MVAPEEYEDYSEMEEYEDNCEMELEVEEGASESDEYEEIEEDEIEYLRVGDPIEIMPYLFPCSTDYLVRKKRDGEERVYADCLKGKKYVIVISFCIPLDMGVDSYLSYDLQDVFPELLAEGRDDFEVVLVVRMNPDFPNFDDKHVAQQAFAQFFSEFPVSFLAVPIWDLDRSNNLFRIMGQDFSECTVVDLERGRVSYTDFDSYIKYGADFYPFTEEREQELRKEADIICSGRMPLANLLRSRSSDVLDCVVHSLSCGKQKSLSSLTNKVVGLYVLHDGYDMDKVLNLYKLCKCNNLEFEVIVVCEKRGGEPAMSVSSWKDYAQSLLRNKDCCGWLHLPFDDRVCRRLNFLCELYGGDKLIIVGPNASYLDPHGMEVIREYGFGVEYYPFTKQAIWDSHVARLRGLRLDELFTTVGINDLIRPDGRSMPVSSAIRDTDTLLYLGYAPELDYQSCSYQGHLLEWFNEIMKSAGNTRCQMIFVCLCCRSEEEGWHCCDSTGKPWMSVAHQEVNNMKLFDLIFDRLSSSKDTLVAFGSDGRVRSVALQDTLLDQCGPATFPKSDDNLRMEVGQLLQYSPFEHWHELFNDTYCDDF